MGAALQLEMLTPPARPRWVNTLHLTPNGFCPQCGTAIDHGTTLPRIRDGKVIAEWRGCDDCLAELRAEQKAKRGRR